MKNLSKALFISLLGVLFCNSIKANNLIFTYDPTNKIIRYFKITSSGGNTNYQSITQNSNLNWDSSKIFFDSENQKVYQYETSSNYWQVYDLATGEWSNETDVGNTGGYSPSTLPIGATSLIKKNTDGSIQIGSDANDIDITAEGLNIDGKSLITQKENGEIHIGENSLITKTKEVTLPDGRKVQPLYAEDEDDNRIPINIDGSKLLIDGVEVIAGDSSQVTTNKDNISTNTSNISTNKSNINSLGEGVAGSTALTAALSALPQISKESKLSCGVGTGAYSSRYAVGFGCASKVNERIDINAGGSYVFGGSKSYGGGTLDSGVVKAGFIFKLGKLNNPTQISLNESKILKKEVHDLKARNNQLLARLEKLEDIALKFQSSSEMISVTTKD
tara:strand:- start:84 stop:1253 length:1170 start_codon:yes stop_codon:yes gene_type:complete